MTTDSPAGNRRPQLTSLAATLEDVAGRVSTIAEAVVGGDDDLSAELFEIERAVRAAHRRLERLLRAR